MGTSTFANYIVVPEIALAKIREDAPFDKVCYIGCGVTTGVGAVLFTAKVEAGANVVVFGLGGIGLNVIQGAKMVGADKIIGVDLNPAREAMARKFGMTHFINPKDVPTTWSTPSCSSPTAAPTTASSASATPQVMRQALECCHKGWGRQHHHRRGGGRRGDRDPPVPAGHRPRVEGLGLRRRARPHRRAEDRRLVHGQARSTSTT